MCSTWHGTLHAADVLPVVRQAEAEEEGLVRLKVDQLWCSLRVIHKHAPHLVGPLCLNSLHGHSLQVRLDSL